MSFIFATNININNTYTITKPCMKIYSNDAWIFCNFDGYVTWMSG